VIEQEITAVKAMLRIHKLYLLSSWSRVLREKLTGFQLVQKSHAFYGTRRLITACTCSYS